MQQCIDGLYNLQRAGHSCFKSNDDIDISQKSDDGINSLMYIFKKKATITILGTDFRYFSNEKVFVFQQNYALELDN